MNLQNLSLEANKFIYSVKILGPGAEISMQGFLNINEVCYPLYFRVCNLTSKILGNEEAGDLIYFLWY
jgi:hypothetical protein